MIRRRDGRSECRWRHRALQLIKGEDVSEGCSKDDSKDREVNIAGCEHSWISEFGFRNSDLFPKIRIPKSEFRNRLLISSSLLFRLPPWQLFRRQLSLQRC